jgi:porin
VRVLFSPNENFGLKAAVYNGDPVGPNCKGDPQVCDPAGLEFRLSDPPLLFAEAFYSYNQKQGLAGTIMLGGWNHFGSFQHQRFDIAGMPIAVTGRPGRPLDNGASMPSLTSSFGACLTVRTSRVWGYSPE